jgi:hypothetical protein
VADLDKVFGAAGSSPPAGWSVIPIERLNCPIVTTQPRYLDKARTWSCLTRSAHRRLAPFAHAVKNARRELANS